MRQPAKLSTRMAEPPLKSLGNLRFLRRGNPLFRGRCGLPRQKPERRASARSRLDLPPKSAKTIVTKRRFRAMVPRERIRRRNRISKGTHDEVSAHHGSRRGSRQGARFLRGQIRPCRNAPHREREGALHPRVSGRPRRRGHGEGDEGAAARAHLQLGSRGLYGRPQFRPPRLSRSTTSTRPARSSWMRASPSTARRATATWRSSGRPTTSRSNCCSAAPAKPSQEPWASMPNTGTW